VAGGYVGLAMASAQTGDTTDGRPGRARSVALAAAVGVAVGSAAIGIVYAIIAIPFYALARVAEPGQGLDRPLIRDGIVNVALPAGLLLGVLTAMIVGVWYARGGRLPDEHR
jgi:hypothetical protein